MTDSIQGNLANISESERAGLDQRLAAVLERINKSSQEFRVPEPELLPVSKGQSIEKIKYFYQRGYRRFGENYVQELQAKANALSDLDIEWVFLGRLQSNKFKSLVASVAEIQSVESSRQALKLNDLASECQRKSPIKTYILVNLESEDSKGGIKLSEVEKLADLVEAKCPHLELCGLMAIPAKEYQDEARQMAAYTNLKEQASKIGLGRTSLGMSGDLELAIAAGTNCVRIGQDLFGPRQPKTGGKKAT